MANHNLDLYTNVGVTVYCEGVLGTIGALKYCQQVDSCFNVCTNVEEAEP